MVAREPESGSTRSVSPWRRRVLQWGPFLLLGLFILLFGWLDGRLKQSDAVGFAPPEPAWQVVTADMPELWSQCSEHPAYGAFQEQGVPFLDTLSVALRKWTGVRPTPERLRFWLGGGAVVAGDGAHCLSSFRPGIALRLAAAIHGVFARDGGEGIRFYGDLAYAWRDGYLLVSTSVDYLTETLENGLAVSLPRSAAPEFLLTWAGEAPGSFRLETSSALPFVLELPLSEDPEAILHHTASWPGAALLLNTCDKSVSDALARTAETVARPLIPPEIAAVVESVVAARWHAAVPPLPAFACPGEQVMALFPPGDPRASTDLARVWIYPGCGDIPATEIAALDSARPMRWNDHEGWLVASPRHVHSWSALPAEGGLLLASDAHLVPQLLDEPPGDGQAGTLYLRVNWPPLTQWAGRQLVDLAEEELLPGLSAQDVRSDWLPYLNGLGSWPMLEAVGSGADNTLRIEGRLAEQAAP